MEHGVRALKAERAILEKQIGATRADAALLALDKLPTVLGGLNELAWQEHTTQRSRAALTVVMAYGLRTDDLLPAAGENLLLGVLDDAYLAFYAATHCGQALPGISAEEIRVGAAALLAALPVEIVPRLERQLHAALDEIEAFAAGVR